MCARIDVLRVLRSLLQRTVHARDDEPRLTKGVIALRYTQAVLTFDSQRASALPVLELFLGIHQCNFSHDSYPRFNEATSVRQRTNFLGAFNEIPRERALLPLFSSLC